MPIHSISNRSLLFGVGAGAGGVIAYTVRDDVGVALQAALGVAVSLLIAGKVPDDQGLVARTGQQHVGAITGVVRTIYSIAKNSGHISYFSREVAREVTQPLWPSRVPRRTSCSAMMGVDGMKVREWGGR